MRNTHRARRAIGAGLALMGIFTLVGGCTAMDPAGGAGESDEGAIVEAEERITTGVYQCSMAGARRSSLIANEDGTCTRYSTHIAGASELYCMGGSCQSCWNVGRKLGCLSVRTARLRNYVTNTPRAYRCTLAGGTIVGALVVRPDATCSRIPSWVEDAKTDFCLDGVCPSCFSLGRDIDCLMDN
ncbi:hypothetical protein [Polyangium jinanense]|uniref:Lipoprotein n=1 Tax=Polyangium jinanense TaxID=2829994 RepID=A0A9X3XFL1_9BACT|nr:hypothetical protein [Polyangium jinanense]MDC3957035.1 hypothetical protein [Polyangium jinanense]MDC3987091.1 hypothetical protein [Polyangium jinanense]